MVPCKNEGVSLYVLRVGMGSRGLFASIRCGAVYVGIGVGFCGGWFAFFKFLSFRAAALNLVWYNCGRRWSCLRVCFGFGALFFAGF
ncbi:hypothetical protein TSUD_221180 [Trifolium subterraneum]|uniref:Transmembrane protein n=1 Tax=Trifolium subterraneum TaxID=3900 RepID=A0A2Z6NBX7_TRISU|nr:hypothetical protein TSUD_221180 [Trifolium subterraneum]